MTNTRRWIWFSSLVVRILILFGAGLVLSGCSDSDPSSNTDRFFLVFQSQGR